MELIEERGANPNREGGTPHNGNTSNNSITGAKLLNGVKKTNSYEDILQYSKTIDSNGEPCVMYHGTRSDFTTFHMHDGSLGRGAYFTSNWNEAAEYAKQKQNVEDIEDLDESKVLEVFLNIRKPAGRNDYNIDSTYNNAGQNERLRLQEAGFDGKEKWKDKEEVIAELSEPTQSVTATNVSKPQVPHKSGEELFNAETAITSTGKTNQSSSQSQKNK